MYFTPYALESFFQNKNRFVTKINNILGINYFSSKCFPFTQSSASRKGVYTTEESYPENEICYTRKHNTWYRNENMGFFIKTKGFCLIRK